MTDYSRPERSAEIVIAHDVRDEIKGCGGCCFCKHRAHLFETLGRRAACGLPTPKQFPRCVDEPGGFEFDEDLYAEDHKVRA